VATSSRVKKAQDMKKWCCFPDKKIATHALEWEKGLQKDRGTKDRERESEIGLPLFHFHH
jgi:hypothetical protein